MSVPLQAPACQPGMLRFSGKDPVEYSVGFTDNAADLPDTAVETGQHLVHVEIRAWGAVLK